MTLYEELINLGEYYFAGYAKHPRKDRFYKTAKAIETHFKYMKMFEVSDNAFYPSLNNTIYSTGEYLNYFYCFSLVGPYGMNNDRLIYIFRNISPENKEAFQKLYDEVAYYFSGQCMNPIYGVGGLSYTHSVINFERVLKEGLNSYYDRIEKNYKKNPSMYDGLKVTLNAINIFRKRTIELLKSQENPNKRLINALKNVPFKPAKDFYEAIVCVNFMFYIDGCDDLGRFDQYMLPYLTEDVSDEEAIELMKNLWQNVNAVNGWQVTLGGCDKKGNNGSNRLSKLVIKSAEGFRRPQISYRMNENESDEIWNGIFDNWLCGSGQPALYNDKLYKSKLKEHIGLKEEEFCHIGYGGCTETNVAGYSNCGSTSCGTQDLLIFEEAMYSYLEKAKDYTDFYEYYMALVEKNLLDAIHQCNLDEELKAKYSPLPIRTLLIEDCIDKGKDFYNGGARYNMESVDFSGTSNLVNALYSIKTLGFGKVYSNRDIINACKNNYVGYENILADIKKLPKFGQDVEEIDLIAKDFFTRTGELILSKKGWRSNTKYSPTFNLFATFDILGRNVGATPDGRLAYEPLGDSIGATQGDDTKGPTALINSVTTIPLENFICSPVFNIRISKKSLRDQKGRDSVKSLIKTYFEKGGMQIQASVVDQAELKDALNHPEKHNNLIVRIGGYSEYFNNLSLALKKEVIKRNEHF